MSYVLCLMSYVLCLMSYVLCLMSYVLCLMSYSMSYVNLLAGEAGCDPAAGRQRAAAGPGGPRHKDDGADGGPLEAEHRVRQGRGQEGRALPHQGGEDLQGGRHRKSITKPLLT
jgi:hypothetical protein